MSDFRKSAFEQLFPGLDTWHDGDLVVARDGDVAGMNRLWTEVARHSDALSIRMQRGQINKDQGTYNSICEIPCNDTMLLISPRIPAFDAVTGLVTPEEPEIGNEAYSFETFAAVRGTRIEIKHYMKYTASSDKSVHRRKASWICAISVLATATHLDIESQMTATLNKSLNVRLTQQLQAKRVYWIGPFSQPITSSEVRTLIRTGADNKVTIFATGLCIGESLRGPCCRIIIRHRSPLLQCIERAESSIDHTERSWVILD